MENDKVLIFTDGACSGNPGPGGYGVVIVKPDSSVVELGDAAAQTTNNRMEMGAVIRGLEFLKSSDSKIWILTDSTYVINGCTKWIFGWKKNGWLNSKKEEVVNKDLWLKLDELCFKFKGKIEWKYVRGHAGIPGNERCDEIAVHFSKNESINLYNGSLKDYSYDILNMPSDMSVPVRDKSKPSKSKKAYSYVSRVNGVVETHKTWPACEAKVKGRSGVKFKKVFSAEEEASLIKEWS